MLGVDRRTVWRLITKGDLTTEDDPLDRRAKLIRREDVQRLARLRRGEASLTVVETTPGQWTHDLSNQVARAKSLGEMERLFEEMVDFSRDHPPRDIVATPEQVARIQIQSSVDQLDDPERQREWIEFLAERSWKPIDGGTGPI